MAREKASAESVAASPPGTVTVLLLCDNVYLPEDPTQADWAGVTTTVRYEGKKDGRRVRVACHPTLAEFLQGREQAEVLD